MMNKFSQHWAVSRFTIQFLCCSITCTEARYWALYVDRIFTGFAFAGVSFDKQTVTNCILIVTQHQLHHRIGEAIVQAQEKLR